MPQLLSFPFLSPVLSPKALVDLNQLDIFSTQGLLTYLAELSDFRMAQGIRYSHLSILAIGICAWLSGTHSIRQMVKWAEQLPQPILKLFGCRVDHKRKCYVAPTVETLRRIYHLTDGEELDQTLKRWLTAACQQPGLNRNTRQTIKHLLNRQEYRLSVWIAQQCGRYARQQTAQGNVQS
ncbi:MAG: transposase family protein [Desulfitobacteriaceae bacterium]